MSIYVCCRYRANLYNVMQVPFVKAIIMYNYVIFSIFFSCIFCTATSRTDKEKASRYYCFFVKISINTAQQYIPTEFKEQFYTYINIYIFDVRVFWK